MTPEVRVVHETPSTGVVDGDRCFGMVAGVKSMRLAIEKAAATGTGWVAVRNSNHFGIAGFYAMMALEHDMVGIAVTNANPLVVPTLSVSRFLGTNPLAVAVPALEEPPFVADFATTPIARGKLAVSEKKGEKVVLVGDTPSESRKGLLLELGYSHYYYFGFPESIDIEIDKIGQTIVIRSVDNSLAGTYASKIRALRVPEPYKGTGIKHELEIIRRKAGKKTG